MDLKQLRALLTVSETRSVTRAAAVLHLVQPAVSRQLRLLEEEMGAPLFTRERNGMELTDAGKLLAEHARRALRELDQARGEIQSASVAVSGVVNLGLLPSTCDLIAGPIAAGVKNKYPGVKLRVITGYAGHLQQWLLAGDLDAALLYDREPTPTLAIEPLLDESLYIVGLPVSGLALRKPRRLSFLTGKPVILPSAPHGIRALVEHECAVQKVTLDVVAEADAMNLQKTFVQHGLGYTVLPGAAILDDVARGVLAAAPMNPALRRRVVSAWPAQKRITRATQCVLDEMRVAVNECVTKGRWAGANLIARR
ncbi:LysR family transcriptional regulator [Ramlibacter albus]|uniref:LysR family transcriptional regulator n=1 Tax=Ramlibacter albus TaxID=2079448 RepID=A0A923ME86_9BURK|nr:LysR family transcriptional regulator [Ramlibacter albus]MBC5767878.1 LysR family transcriptional regulator [Ramlibacter albus]